MTGTAVATRSTLDLTRSPSEQWSDEMVKLVAAQLFRGRDVTKGELYYSLAIAESIALNPLINEIYFIPSKSTDGRGPSLQPYIGRNGLVKKAAQRGYYFEADTVREHDKFRMMRQRDGSRTVTHSYGHEKDRGAIVGAYAFLHRRGGGELPAFAYAPLDEYLPTFDADWKMAKSPWGNQRSGMIQKCAMIMAGRERLELGNVLVDGELPIYEQMRAAGPGSLAAPPAQDAPEFDVLAVTKDAELAAALAAGVEVAGWPAAKCEMVMAGRSDDELRDVLAQLEREGAASARVDARETLREESEGDGGSEGDAGADGAVVDATVVDEEHVAGLRKRLKQLEADLDSPGGVSAEQAEQITEEIERVQRELAAAEDPGQGRLI